MVVGPMIDQLLVIGWSRHHYVTREIVSPEFEKSFCGGTGEAYE